MSYPSSIPSYAGFTSSHTLQADGHAGQHNSEQADIVALATKVGTGSATPTSNTVLRGTGAGTTNFDQVHLATDVSGTLPVASGGTGVTTSTGSGNTVLSSSPTVASPAISTPTITVGGSWSGSPSIAAPSLTGQPTISDFTNATHSHQNVAGGGTLNAASAIQSSSITGNLIASYSTSRNNNGTDITETAAKIQTGWVTMTPGVNNTVGVTVTFPVAYTNVPIVVAVFGGDTAGATSTLGAGGINIKQAYGDATNLSTTGFLAFAATRDSTNWSAGNTVYVQWIAIGT